MNQKSLATIAHALGLLPYVGFIGILLIYLNNQFDPVVSREAKKSMNFQVVVLLLGLVVGLVGFIGLDSISKLAGEILYVGEIVLVLLATLTTYLGKEFHYPVKFNLFR